MQPPPWYQEATEPNGQVSALLWSMFDADAGGPEPSVWPLLAGGTFASVGSQTVNGIALWNGTAWRTYGAGMGPTGAFNVLALAIQGGQLAAGGGFETPGADIARLVNDCPGACCIAGNCAVIPPSACLTYGGVFFGQDSQCATVACPPACPAEINADHLVNVVDLLSVINAWGSCP